MFGIGSTELLVILLVALIVLGPKSLAKVSRSLGKAMGEFRRVSTDFQRTLNAESAEADLREREAARRKAAADAGAAPGKDAETKPAPEATAAQAPDAADEADSLIPPEGSPLAEALEKARAEAEAATQGAAPDNASAADAASPASPTPPTDGPRA
ncbi:MAG: twin-arginine translocase subunit TatB [Desulfovibrio sp.]|nr:twin-arginine translocase subunit TatB [Desulfovibrio sp.]